LRYVLRMRRHSVIPTSLLCLPLCLVVATGCGGDDDETTAEPAAPTLPEGLEPGWNEILPGGDTICSRGSAYAFFVRPGTVNRVIIDFIGGGACWDEVTCSVADAIFTPDVENVRAYVATDDPHGIYDHDHPENPFADWYHVVIPYCTGDIHWGDNVTTYGSGASEVTINHKGAVNSRAVLEWIYEGFSAPEQIVVTGCSAGSYGSAMWAPHIARHYPSSQIVQLGDSGAGVITDDFFQESFPAWSAEGAFPNWIDALDPDQVSLVEQELADLYVGVANYYPDHQFAQYNTAFDENQTFYFTAMGGSDAAEWSARMHASIADIEARADTFVSFIASGEQHCIIPYDNFYTVNVDGVRLVDWVDDLLAKTPVDSQACTACDEPTP